MKRTVRNFKETIEIRSSLLVRFRSNRYLPIALVTAVFLLAACVHIWQRVRVLDLVQEVSYLRLENLGLADDTRKVYAEVATLSRASRIHAYATDTLGLGTVAATGMFTMLREDGAAPSAAGGLDMVLSAAKRFTAYLPSVTQTRASAGELRNPLIDSLANGGATDASDADGTDPAGSALFAGVPVFCGGGGAAGAFAGSAAPEVRRDSGASGGGVGEDSGGARGYL